METEFRSTIPDLPSTSDLVRLARSPVALLDHLGTIESSETLDPAPDAQERATITDAPGDVATIPAGWAPIPLPLT
jgi:hypothetical protein